MSAFKITKNMLMNLADSIIEYAFEDDVRTVKAVLLRPLTPSEQQAITEISEYGPEETNPTFLKFYEFDSSKCKPDEYTVGGKNIGYLHIRTDNKAAYVVVKADDDISSNEIHGFSFDCIYGDIGGVAIISNSGKMITYSLSDSVMKLFNENVSITFPKNGIFPFIYQLKWN